MNNVYGLKEGDWAYRRNSHDRWILFPINKTYLELIAEFPEDYRPIWSMIGIGREN